MYNISHSSRKSNLIGNPLVDGPRAPDYTTFKTDFGVEFGILIGYDLLFRVPSTLIINGYKNVIFSTSWASELPFLSSINLYLACIINLTYYFKILGVQIQQAWAYTHNMNLLGACANDPANGVSGSGIFAGKQGALKSGIFGQQTNEVFISEITKDPGTNIDPPRQTHAADTPDIQLRRDKLQNFILSPLTPSTTSTNLNVCQEDLCCSWTYSMEETIPIENTVYIIKFTCLNGTYFRFLNSRNRIHMFGQCM